MKIYILNKDLGNCSNFLFDIKLKKEESRAKSKLMKLINRKHEEYVADIKALTKEYAELDEAVNPIPLNETMYKVTENMSIECQNEVNKLGKEVAIIEGGEYVNQFKTIKTVLENYDEEMEGFKAEAYDVLLDAFEEAKIK